MNIMNVNVGVLGHVDSGKTSLVRALSTQLSTASLDKNPQSRERGMTLDLGFSSFIRDIPAHLKGKCSYDSMQITLVDCPGHASLIRTVIGGAQIIDMMILSIDVISGVQTQTAECLVLGEILTDKMIIVLNKIDLFPEHEREARISSVKKNIRKIFSGTKFANCPMVEVAAHVGGGGEDKEKDAQGMAVQLQNTNLPEAPKLLEGRECAPPSSSLGMETLTDVLCGCVSLPDRDTSGPFLFSVDHCFPIRGKGTVITGTVLNGSVQLQQNIELSSLRISKKVKSMQVFHKGVSKISQGDRAGICLSGLDAKLVERGFASTPGSIPLVSRALVLVKKIRFFKGTCPTESKMHVSVGHSTVIAKVHFFGALELGGSDGNSETENISSSSEKANDQGCNDANTPGPSEVVVKDGDGHTILASSIGQRAVPDLTIPDMEYDERSEYIFQDKLIGPFERPSGLCEKAKFSGLQWALVEFEVPVLVPDKSVIIGSRLDLDAHAKSCRLTFYGKIVRSFVRENEDYKKAVKIYKLKEREGVIDRLSGETRPDGKSSVIIGKSLFKKETDMTQFVGMSVETELGEVGEIISSFGKSGKFKVSFAKGTAAKPKSKIFLRFRKYMFDPEKKMYQ